MQVSIYRGPKFGASGSMQQGMYSPKPEVWENLYDPIYVLLRAVQRKDFQNSLDRFKQYCKQSGKVGSRVGNLWPPYRLPSAINPANVDPRKILACRSFHGILLAILYKALHEANVSDHVLALTIFLLELVVEYQAANHSEGEMMAASEMHFEEDEDKPDGQFIQWFNTQDIFLNACFTINRVHLNPSPSVSSESDGEMETSDFELEEIENVETRLALPTGHRLALTTGSRPLTSGSELVPYNQDANAIVPSSTELPDTPDTPTTSPLHLALPAATSTVQSSSSTGDNMLVPLQHSPTSPTPEVTSLISSSLPSSSQYPSLLAGNEVGRNSSSNRKVRQRLNFRFRRKSPHRDSSIQGSSDFPFNFRQLPSILDSGDEYINIGESIISLLIKLHSKLSGKPGSYKPNFEEDKQDSRIGDGQFFISKVLNKFGYYDSSTRNFINKTIQSLYPKNEDESSASEEEAAILAREKRKRAKEYQRKIMAEFAKRQKTFLQSHKWAENPAPPSDSADNSIPSTSFSPSSNVDSQAMEVDDDKIEKHKEYDCVICAQSIPSTPESPVGMCVLLQATSVLGHRSSAREPHKLPTSDEERNKLRHQNYTFSQHMEDISETLNIHFDQSSVLLSQNIGWEGGVHIQTCGHHLHVECHEKFMASLRSRPRQASLVNVDKGEITCPLCRQLANSVLPISPEIGDFSAIVRHEKSVEEECSVDEIDYLLSDLTVPVSYIVVCCNNVYF